MTSIQKTVFICDRCGTENGDNGTIRRIGLDESSVLHDQLGSTLVRHGGWASEVENVDVCRACFDELLALWDVWMQGGDADDE